MREFTFAPRHGPFRVEICKITSDQAEMYIREAHLAGYDVFRDEQRNRYFVIVLSYQSFFRKETR